MVFWNFPPIPCQLSGSIPQKEKLAKSRVTLDLGFYHFNCRIRPHGWFLFDIQHIIIVWGYNLSYHLEIKANSEGYILEPSQSYTGALMMISIMMEGCYYLEIGYVQIFYMWEI